MIAAYRLLADRLAKEGPDWNYPLHLGVTEAGDGEDGRIKSAIGIGSLLNDGIGDTVRVSLTEDSVHEIPVARALVGLFGKPLPAADRRAGRRAGTGAFLRPVFLPAAVGGAAGGGRDRAGRGRGAARGACGRRRWTRSRTSSTAWAISSRNSCTNRRACARSIRAMPPPSP